MPKVRVKESATCVSGLDIKIARIKAGMRQYELAKNLGIFPSRLSEIEAGRRKVTPELFRQILKVLAAQPNKLQN